MYKKPTSVPLKKPLSRGSQVVDSSQPKSKYIGQKQKQKEQNLNIIKKYQTQSIKEIDLKTKKQQNILGLIRQYLLDKGYGRTFQTLKRQKPIAKVQKSQPSNVGRRLNNSTNIRQQDEKLLIKIFQKGQRDEFFKHVNKWMNLSDQFIGKLQFELQIYFCIYSVHPSIKKASSIQKGSIQAFKKFMQSRASQISQSQQYINFYSLPYIPKPQQNPALAVVFTKQWISNLKQKLQHFLHQKINLPSQQLKVSKQIIKKSGLQEMYQHYQSGDKQKKIQFSDRDKKVQFGERDANDLLQVKTHNQYLLKYIQKLTLARQELAETSKANLLQSNKKWFFFTKDLLNIVHKAKGTTKIEGLQKYYAFFGKNVDQIINNVDVSIFDKQSMMADDYSYVIGGNNNGPNTSKQFQVNNRSGLDGRRQQTAPSQIDMVKIQTLFANADDPSKQTQVLLLLKALKNRFKKLKNPFLKRQIIIQYSRHDICGVTPQKYYIQKRLLLDGSQKIKEFYLRLMDSISSDIYGIQYLAKSQKLIENLVNMLKEKVLNETNDKRFVLSVIQKFSYLKKSRSKIMSLGIIPLIFKIFESQKQQVDEINLQYLTAMILNFSLKKQAQKQFINYKSQLILILMSLSGHENQAIKNYSNGSLFILLSYNEILQQAKRLGVQKKMLQLINDYDTNQLEVDKFYGQYNYILQKIRGQTPLDQEDDETQDDDDQNIEFDQFEDDQGQDQTDSQQSSDYIDGEQNFTPGEQIIVKDYMLLGPDALREHLLTRSVLDQTAKKMNNMTLSINHSKRMDNIFNKQRASQQLQPQLDKLIHQNQQIVHKLNQNPKRML